MEVVVVYFKVLCPKHGRRHWRYTREASIRIFWGPPKF